MSHKVKSLLILLVLVTVLFSIGILMGSGNRITGAAVVEGIACYDDSDCDDKLPETEDLCRNPGTGFSLCVNKPVV